MGSRLGSGRRRRRLNAIGWKLCPSASRDVCLFRAPQCFAILLASGGTSALATSDSSAQTGAARSVRHERIARTHRRDRRSHSKPIPRRHRFGDDAITPSAAGKTVSTRSESRYRFVQIRSRDVTHRDRFAPHEIVLWWSASDSLRSPARQSLATACATRQSSGCRTQSVTRERAEASVDSSFSSWRQLSLITARDRIVLRAPTPAFLPIAVKRCR